MEEFLAKSMEDKRAQVVDLDRTLTDDDTLSEHSFSDECVDIKRKDSDIKQIFQVKNQCKILSKPCLSTTRTQSSLNTYFQMPMTPLTMRSGSYTSESSKGYENDLKLSEKVDEKLLNKKTQRKLSPNVKDKEFGKKLNTQPNFLSVDKKILPSLFETTNQKNSTINFIHNININVINNTSQPIQEIPNSEITLRQTPIIKDIKNINILNMENTKPQTKINNLNNNNNFPTELYDNDFRDEFILQERNYDFYNLDQNSRTNMLDFNNDDLEIFFNFD
jgi:hypothetical protein